MAPVRFLSIALAVSASLQAAEQPLQFNRDIRPILSDKCFACHGTDAKHREGVANKCFEPDALFYLGKIYQAAGQTKTARKYFQTAEKSAYELGPVVSQQITESLKAL